MGTDRAIHAPGSCRCECPRWHSLISVFCSSTVCRPAGGRIARDRPCTRHPSCAGDRTFHHWTCGGWEIWQWFVFWTWKLMIVARTHTHTHRDLIYNKKKIKKKVLCLFAKHMPSTSQLQTIRFTVIQLDTSDSFHEKVTTHFWTHKPCFYLAQIPQKTLFEPN